MTEIRERFRKLIAAPETLVMPGAYDGLSAKLIERAGFKTAIAGGYAALGSMHAEPDMGQSNMRDMTDHYARVCKSVDIPVLVDADTGFGGIHNVCRMVRAFEDAGAAGFFISDQVFPNRCGYLPGKRVIPIEEMLAKLKAALDARRDSSFVVGGRTDAAGVLGHDAAIERAQMFVEIGVDVVKPQTMDRREDIQRIMREVKAPFLATLSQAAGKHPLDLFDFVALGVPAVSLPSTVLFAAVAAVRDTLAKIRETGSIRSVQNDIVGLEDYYELVGLPDFQAREESYAAEAARIVERMRAKAKAG
jgi:2-methylisocitrate lyase-like PEP mutase family enzyme